MKAIKLKGIEEILYTDVLDNGLELYFLPNNKAKNFYITYNVKFGSIHTSWVNNKSKKEIKVPNGTAHFLEHLMFQEPDGTTAHEHFALLGSSCNAATSFKLTYYEVLGTTKFKENLEYLLDYVHRPYFTKQNVQDEKNIIIEEIKMGENSPYTELVFKSLTNTYFNSGYRHLISGTTEDIKKMTVEDIQTCYDNFYHPKNMFIIITGNFNPEEAKAIIVENLHKKEIPEYLCPKTKKATEPIKVVKEYEEVKMNVEVPKVSMKIKLALNKFKDIKLEELNIYLNIILDLKFGDTSLLKERLLQNNLITDAISFSVTLTDTNVLISLMFETMYPKETIAIIKSELNDLSIKKEELLRKGKVLTNDLILSYDDILVTCEDIQNDIINYDKVVDNYFEIFKNLNYTNANKIIKNININNMAILVIKPMEE